MVGDRGENLVFREHLLLGDQPFCSKFSSLYRTFKVKIYLYISGLVGNVFLFYFIGTLILVANLSNLEIEDLERFMSSLTCKYLSPSILNART